MITRDQVVNLLAVCAAYDNRLPSEAVTIVWLESATRSRWTEPEAEDAIHEHYAAHTERIMPAHVNGIIRAKRQDRALRGTAAELTNRAIGAGDDWQVERAAQHRARVLTEMAQTLADRKRIPDADSEQPVRVEQSPEIERMARREPCDYCRARPFNPCTAAGRNGSRRQLVNSHPTRTERALASQGATEVAQ